VPSANDDNLDTEKPTNKLLPWVKGWFELFEEKELTLFEVNR